VSYPFLSAFTSEPNHTKPSVSTTYANLEGKPMLDPSWFRGSNENANRIIRRFIPTGCDISKCTHRQIQRIEEWINNYPRKILNFKTGEEMFIQELAA
jgi:hypothetical protein